MEGPDARAKGVLQDVLAGLAQADVCWTADSAVDWRDCAADVDGTAGCGGVLGLVCAVVAAAADCDGRAAAGGAFSGLGSAVGWKAVDGRDRVAGDPDDRARMGIARGAPDGAVLVGIFRRRRRQLLELDGRRAR